MALDVGRVRIGVALSDPLGYTAQPLLTLWRRSRGEDLRSLLRLMRKHEVRAIVVGNPLHVSGTVSLKQICHPDRSVAKWRDLLCAPIPRAILEEGPPPSPLSSRVADLPGGKSRME